MSETETTEQKSGAVQIDGLFAFKVGMSAIFEKGERIPVTVLKYEPMVVSQIKNKENDGYESMQVAFVAERASQSNGAMKKGFEKAGFENGAKFVRELRFDKMPEGVAVGTKIGLDSLKKGDTVKVTGLSRGRGFQGAVRRWNFNGGPATHGSGFHRRPGSVGNRTWPGRVMPGKRMAGQWGNETVTVRNLQIVDVIAEENVVLVRGPVPGSRNSLVCLTKV
ncbi:MAG TPA: 50S ribosomal protein L3 [Bdellovibrionales bacterium]|nr:50S ribosomal protein L3 [Bdellovibrionales bacterium]